MLDAIDGANSVLLLEEPGGEIAREWVERGAEVTHWRRRVGAFGDVGAWPSEGAYDRVVLRLPKARDELDMMLDVGATRLAPAGVLWLYGAKDEGIESAVRRVEGRFERVETRAVGGRCRLLEVCGPRPGARGRMDDWRDEVRFEHRVLDGVFVSWPGCFAHGRLDVGTRVLLDHLPEIGAGAEVLDFACGIGPLGAAVGRVCPDGTITMLDHDALALHAAGVNVPGARCVLSDGLAALDGRVFDVVLANPPYHAGKASTHAVVQRLADDLGRVLAPDGRARFVVQGSVPIDRIFGRGFREVRPIATEGGFRVWDVSSPTR